MKRFFFCFLFIFNSLFSQIDFGQKFILALPFSDSKKYLKIWLQKTKPAGVMLQTFHLKNRENTKKLVKFLQNEAKKIGIPKLFISIDWEGGIFSRPNESNGFISVPSPRNLAAAGRTYCFLAGKLIGQQLKSVGINMNFAPSLDLFDSNNVILGSRTFSSNPSYVFKCAQAFANGLKSENIIPVFKHFPGIGLGSLDTHSDKVNINLNKKEFANHIYPFIKVLKKEPMPFLMVGHAKYPSIFGIKPATLSNNVVKWIKKRNTNSFLVTDDFAMKAVRVKKDLYDVVFDSLGAGFDLIIFSAKKGEDIKLIMDLESNIDKLSKGELIKINLGMERINNFKREYLTYLDQPCLLPEKKLGKILAQRSIKEFYKNLDIRDTNSLLVSVDLPKIRHNERWFIEKNNSYLQQKLQEFGRDLQELIFNPKDSNSIEMILSRIKEFIAKDNNNKIIIQTIFYGSGIWNNLQQKLLKGLKKFQNKLILISLGHPYEKNILPNSKYFDLGSFSVPMLEYLSKKIVTNNVVNSDFSVKKLLDLLNNKKIGLLCHHASRINIGNKKIFMPDFLFNFAKKQANNTELVAIFSPEHGLRGNFGAYTSVKSEVSSKWGCPIYSLHGKHKKPTKEMLKNLDLLVIDLHEVGIRPFTYLTTLFYCMQESRKNDLPVLVIDHVNPLYFWNAQGPELKDKFKSFVGRVEVPFIHGKTIGKIAKHLNKDLNADLTVLPTLPNRFVKYFFRYNNFFSPSPNLATLSSIYLYPITIFLEGTNYSEGRGTLYPFQQFGAPWVNAFKLADNLNSKKLPGIYFEPITFRPISIKGKSMHPKHENKKCQGVFLHLYDLKKVEPILTAKSILSSLNKLYPEKMQFIRYSNGYFLDHLVGNDTWRKELLNN